MAALVSGAVGATVDAAKSEMPVAFVQRLRGANDGSRRRLHQRDHGRAEVDIVEAMLKKRTELCQFTVPSDC